MELCGRIVFLAECYRDLVAGYEFAVWDLECGPNTSLSATLSSSGLNEVLGMDVAA